jgi:pyridoxamine 5'-phosphate oxidase
MTVVMAGPSSLPDRRETLEEGDVPPDPLEQVRSWLAQAVAAGVVEANAMCLATASPDGVPAARMVLLKAVDDSGLVFYTNLGSDKARDLAANPRAAAVLHWPELARQVRVAGVVTRLPEEESAAYFATRPRGSQLASWASHQSETVASRAALEERFEAMVVRFGEGPVPLPPFWGGFRVHAEVVECWQGRPNRLHDRLRWRRSEPGWVLERLAP